MENKISFNKIKSLFDESWDVGVISKEQLLEVSLHPIKAHFHYQGDNFTNDIHFNGLTNTIVLIKQGHTWDYTHYQQAIDILEKGDLKNWFQIYTNFKEAALRAGLGVRARNSLIYSYKFGFDCHIATFGFKNEIVDLPTNKRHNKKLWNRCKNCDDCVVNCPVGAIHGKEEPYWLNSSSCDNFISSSDHPHIPSIKKFWHENVYPEISKSVVDNIKTWQDIISLFGQNGFPWDKNGYSFDGNVIRKDGVAINVPFCRECTSQPKCSKWNGKFPYEEELKPIKFYRKTINKER